MSKKNLILHISSQELTNAILETNSPIPEEFFKGVLGIDMENVLFTDASELSDFSLCGDYVPDDSSKPLEDLYKEWDFKVLDRIRYLYDIDLESTRIKLNDLFIRIQLKKY